ncbi:hypothetical protein DFJ63DRAFT_176126 [Scheffersomyces coipomensis]|uniref:uncharacterized protein n=1 Tax=Scheffersomyces coipomensis TaxID=1788519 RepID=UPI00315C60A6
MDPMPCTHKVSPDSIKLGVQSTEQPEGQNEQSLLQQNLAQETGHIGKSSDLKDNHQDPLQKPNAENAAKVNAFDKTRTETAQKVSKIKDQQRTRRKKHQLQMKEMLKQTNKSIINMSTIFESSIKELSIQIQNQTKILNASLEKLNTSSVNMNTSLLSMNTSLKNIDISLRNINILVKNIDADLFE